jgi:hypothetical protein
MNGQTYDFACPDTLTIARDLLARGYKPLPIPIGAKNPTLRNWQNLSITAENVTHYFNRSTTKCRRPTGAGLRWIGGR